MYMAFYNVLLLAVLSFMLNPKTFARYLPEHYFETFEQLNSSKLQREPESTEEREHLVNRLRRVAEDDELLTDIRNINWFRGISADEKSLRQEEEDQSRLKRDFFAHTRDIPSFSYNFQKIPNPSHNFGVLQNATDSPNTRKLTDFNDDFSKILTGGKLKGEDSGKVQLQGSEKKDSKRSVYDLDETYDSIIEALKKILEKTEKIKEKGEKEQRSTKSKRRAPNDKVGVVEKDPKSRTFLDFSNSQVPFNEGNAKFRSSNPEYYAFMNQDVYPVNAKMVKRYGDKVREKRDEKLTAVICPLEGETDDKMKSRIGKIIQYRFTELVGNSRLRRDSGQEKKRCDRKGNTLEAKELAMERVLDPNLNNDGILEPHVRYRRDVS